MGGEAVLIKGFLEVSLLDWPGRMASVVFLPGCNFRCPFCHNPGLVLSPEELEDFPVKEVLAAIGARAGWIDGVVITGGEPTVSAGIMHLLHVFKRRGIPVKLDTNGSRPEILREILEKNLISAAAMDIKAPLVEDAYSAAAGVKADIAAIKESITLLSRSGIELFFRATMVPGLHDAAAVREMASAVPERLTLQGFRPADRLVDLSFGGIKPFTEEQFRLLQDTADNVCRERLA
ncbi:MAG TPA: anaerobic ribonucleoside-triphosphate reductase activating protein [Nitrospirota bacterium]|jgi:pyruvate formate lyase activating enzyme